MVERQGVDNVVVKGPVEADVSKHISDQYDDIICIHIKLRVPIPSHMVHTCRVESCQKPTWRQQNVSVYFLGGCWVLRCVVSRVYIILLIAECIYYFVYILYILCLSSMIARGHYGVFAWCVFIPTTAALLMCLSRCFGNRCECFHELYYWRSLPLVHRSPLSRLLSFSKLYTFLISFTLYISSFISFSPSDVYPTTICIVACSMVTICHHIVL